MKTYLVSRHKINCDYRMNTNVSITCRNLHANSCLAGADTCKERLNVVLFIVTTDPSPYSFILHTYKDVCLHRKRDTVNSSSHFEHR